MAAFRTRCRACGAPIDLVLCIPELPVKGERRRHVPIDPTYDPGTATVPASHALSTGRTTCRVITADRPIAPHEFPALTHFATCPAAARRRLEETR